MPEDYTAFEPEMEEEDYEPQAPPELEAEDDLLWEDVPPWKPSEPILTGTLALGAGCSLLCVALVAPQKGTTPLKAAVALIAPLVASAGVGYVLRSVVIPAADIDEGV